MTPIFVEMIREGHVLEELVDYLTTLPPSPFYEGCGMTVDIADYKVSPRRGRDRLQRATDQILRGLLRRPRGPERIR